MSAPARIEPGGFRELGPINWAIAKLGARTIRAPRFTLMNVLGQHKLLFLAWLPYSGMLLGLFSKLPVRDAEVVILRIGHLRDCEYELQQRALITATDEFVVTRGVSPETWATLASHLNKAQLIEFCMLSAQYDGLAATIATLNVPLDFPD